MPRPEANTGTKTGSKKVAAKKSSKKASSTSRKKTSKRRPARRTARRRGQQSIDSARTVQIQEALIQNGYLNGEPSGRMDAATKQALVKLQAENGWQTKVVPDSRALIKLGLGPDHSNLLNPDTAMIPTLSNTAQSGQPE